MDILEEYYNKKLLLTELEKEIKYLRAEILRRMKDDSKESILIEGYYAEIRYYNELTTAFLEYLEQQGLQRFIKKTTSIETLKLLDRERTFRKEEIERFVEKSNKPYLIVKKIKAE